MLPGTEILYVFFFPLPTPTTRFLTTQTGLMMYKYMLLRLLLSALLMTPYSHKSVVIFYSIPVGFSRAKKGSVLLRSR